MFVNVNQNNYKYWDGNAVQDISSETNADVVFCYKFQPQLFNNDFEWGSHGYLGDI